LILPVSPTAPLSPETPPTPTLPEEPPTVVRSRGKRRAARKNGKNFIIISTTIILYLCIGFLPTTSISLETENDSGSEQKSLYFKGKDNSQDIILCLNDIINNIVEQENINNCVNQSVDIISTVDELVENTASIVIPQKEDLVAAQNLTSHSENNINRKKEESLSSVNELDREGILTNMPVDEFTPATDIDNAPIAYPDQENVQTEILNETLPTLTKSDDIPFERSDTEDELSTMTNVVESPIKHIESEDELPTLNNVVQSPNEHFDPADELPVLTNVVESPAENSNPEDQFAMLPNIDDTPIAHPDPENNQMEILYDESSALANINVTPTEHSHSQDEVSVLKNDVQSPIEHSDSIANDSITLEDSIITPPNEFEDSFDALKTPTIQITRPSEDPLEKLTDLAALREFISKLDEDIDVDEEASPPKHDTISINEKVINQSEQQDTPDITEDTSSSFQTSISNDIQEYASSESTSQTDLSIDEPSIDDKIENTSTALIEETLVEKKRFSVVNCHSIPPGVKIIQMICSSTYVYICTNDRKIFYAKLNLSNTDLPLKWQQHSDPAERLIVSVTNRTVWRLSNKRLYSSNDPLKFPPIGSQWNEIKIGNEQSFLSISINDQCGWYIKEDGSLWLIRTNDETCEALNVACPFNLNKVFCFSEKVGVTTCDGEILIRVGCTDDCLEGDGWIFIDHRYRKRENLI
jgi:rRNA-processing protein FCF1